MEVQIEFGFVKSLYASLDKRALFLVSDLWTPRPPSSFTLVIVSHLIMWIFFLH